jgi:hypothetical protein
MDGEDDRNLMLKKFSKKNFSRKVTDHSPTFIFLQPNMPKSAETSILVS